MESFAKDEWIQRGGSPLKIPPKSIKPCLPLLSHVHLLDKHKSKMSKHFHPLGNGLKQRWSLFLITIQSRHTNGGKIFKHIRQAKSFFNNGGTLIKAV